MNSDILGRIVSPEAARIFAEPITGACDRFQITTAERQAAFVSQYAHETSGFTRLVENLNYKADKP